MTAILLTLVILSGCNKGKSIKEHNELGYVYPIPQNYSYNDHNIPDISKVKIVCPEDIDSVTLNDLKQYLKESKKSTVTIHIGLNNNPDIEYELTKAGLEKQIKPEGYILYAKDNKIIMSGSDNRGIYYALQSFKMLAENKRIKETNISDYPQIPVRGVIEGFYGEPWSHKDRLSLLDFFGNIKMNTYIYAPKDDPKHRSAWREEYTTEEIKLMKELIEKANSNHVDFVFSVSPGNDIRFDVNYSNDFQALVKKTESMYDIGIRSFAIFLDDIVKKNADNHAKLVNDYQGYLNTKEGVKPLICIFTEYTTPMYTKAYTDKISSLLNDKSIVMWTGSNVIPSNITKKDIEWINNKYDRQVLIWWNYPVNDAWSKDHLFMGPCENLDINLNEVITGLVSNPMNQAEASKIPLFTIADYLWNPVKYNSETSHRNAIKYLYNYMDTALSFFTAHVSANTINNNTESIEMAKLLKEYEDIEKEGKDTKEISGKVLSEFVLIMESTEYIQEKCRNKDFLEEISPWLNKLHTYSVMGVNLFKAAEAKDKGEDIKQYIDEYLKAKELLVETEVIVSEKVIKQFIESEDASIFSYVGLKDKLVFLETTSFTNFAQYEDYGVENVTDGKLSTFFWTSGPPAQAAPAKKGYIALDAGIVKKINNIYIATGKDDTDLDIMGKAVIEYSANKENWTEIKNDTFSNIIYIDGLDIEARYVRIRSLDTTTSYWIKMRTFELNTTRRP